MLHGRPTSARVCMAKRNIQEYVKYAKYNARYNI